MVDEDATSLLASELRASVFRLARRLRQQRSVETMSDGQFAVLAALKQHGPHTLGELADRERVTAPSMNRTVNCLQELGYLVRTEHDDDRRKVNIEITESGRTVIEETVHLRDRWLAAVLADLDDDDRAALRRAAQIIQEKVTR